MSDLDAAWEALYRAIEKDPDFLHHVGTLNAHRPLIEAAARAASTPEADRLAEAMDEVYEYIGTSDLDQRPELPFVDDAEGFWRPFAVKVRAALQGTQVEGGERLREAAEAVMRNVVVGSWYDEPAQAGPAVSRLHDAEAAMWRLYDLLGVDPGDAYTLRAALPSPLPEDPTL